MKVLIRIVFLIVLTLPTLVVRADAYPEMITVGLFYKSNLQHIVLTAEEGSYDVLADGKSIYTLEGKKAVQVIREGNRLKLMTWSEDLGSCQKLELLRRSWGSIFKMKPVKPAKHTRLYHGNLSVEGESSRLKLINEVYLEHYVAGVVEAEAGTGKSPEFYKVQAIICRTYALSHLNKFISSGFNLCDGVECQVYKGKSRHEPAIPAAVKATRGMVIVDSEINLITAAFHSNSGGYTVNSEHAWQMPVAYLRAKPDTFSLNMPHYEWEKEVSKSDWLAYLKREHEFPTDSPEYLTYATNYTPASRQIYLSPDGKGLLKQIRVDWKLRSTFFSIEDKGDKLLLRGKGFGHGVGMSQEGAMKMANLGYSYTDILHYYYTDVHLIDLSVIDFFREE